MFVIVVFVEVCRVADIFKMVIILETNILLTMYVKLVFNIVIEDGLIFVCWYGNIYWFNLFFEIFEKKNVFMEIVNN